MAKKTFDVIVIGAGSAGFSAAQVASQKGANVCLIEKEHLGGECPNWACVPTKALLHSAKSYYFAKYELSALGVRAHSVDFSFSKIMKRKEAVVATISKKGKRLEHFAQARGIEVVKGAAAFVNAHTVAVRGETYNAKKIVIATGSKTFIPPIHGLKKSGYLTFRDAVSLKRLPSSMVIIGGGPVGCEFATFFAMLGTQVTLIQATSTVLHREDPEIAIMAQKQLTHLGIHVVTNAKVLSVLLNGRKKKVTYQQASKRRQSIDVTHVLVATGKRANVQSLQIKKAGVQLDEKGGVTTDLYQRTNVKHIFACGDVDGGMQFTHTAHSEGAVVGHNVMQKSARAMKKCDHRVVPRVTFVHPEVASVGMTVAQALKAGVKIDVASFPVGSLGRSVTENKRVGLVKILFEKTSKEIVGGHMIGARAGEVIHEIALAMHLGARVQDVAKLIHAFPTYSESIPAALAPFE